MHRYMHLPITKVSRNYFSSEPHLAKKQISTDPSHLTQLHHIQKLFSHRSYFDTTPLTGYSGCGWAHSRSSPLAIVGNCYYHHQLASMRPASGHFVHPSIRSSSVSVVMIIAVGSRRGDQGDMYPNKFVSWITCLQRQTQDFSFSITSDSTFGNASHLNIRVV